MTEDRTIAEVVRHIIPHVQGQQAIFPEIIFMAWWKAFDSDIYKLSDANAPNYYTPIHAASNSLTKSSGGRLPLPLRSMKP